MGSGILGVDVDLARNSLSVMVNIEEMLLEYHLFVFVLKIQELSFYVDANKLETHLFVMEPICLIKYKMLLLIR